MCAPIELTAFDFDLEVEANVGIDLTVLGDYTLFDSTVWDPDPWRLFDLPEAEPSFEGAGPVTIFANVADGANNPLDPASVEWEVAPETTGFLEPDATDPTIARLTCSVADTYTIAFSGHGNLGELARRCEELEVECWPTGPIRAWGYNWRGGLGDGTENNRSVPIPVNKLPDATAISAGYLTSYAVREDGTVWAWGYNPTGELPPGEHGVGTLYPIQITGLEDMVAVSGYYRTILALKADGTVWAWGYNGFGQIGDGTTDDRWTPVQVPGLSNVIAIETGQDHCLALKDDGTVWAWGGNQYGQLGDGSTTDRAVPAPVPGLSDIISISAGQYHSLALKDEDENTVWGWGSNYLGASGGTTYGPQPTATKIPGFEDVRFIRAGADYSYAIKQDGTLWGLGLNQDYQLGDGTDINRLEPVWVHEFEGVRSVSAGFLHNLIVKEDGSVWTWGYEYYGVLGNGYEELGVPHDPPSLRTPTQVLNLSDPAVVSATWFHTLAITE
jgi:alpha-tubulin suppressor-like RCC1 family protein